MPLDFTINLHTDSIEKIGHYSRAENRDATREEVLLWQRVLELEGILADRRPPEAKVLLDRLMDVPDDAIGVKLNATDFAILRQHAWDRVRMVVNPELNRKHIVGEMPIVNDGSPSTLWLYVDRDVPKGEMRPIREGT
jgi:hypothetical protein